MQCESIRTLLKSKFGLGFRILKAYEDICTVI